MSAILSENVSAIDDEMSLSQAVALVSAYASTFDAIIQAGENPHHYSHHDVLCAALLVLLNAGAAKRCAMHVAFELICEAYDDDEDVKDAVVGALINELTVELTLALSRRAAQVMKGGAA